MTIQANVQSIETDIEAFFEGLKQNAITPVQNAISAGGKDLAADANAVIGVATAAAAAASNIPGAVGAAATIVEGFIPFAQELIALIQGISKPAAATAAATPVATAVKAASST